MSAFAFYSPNHTAPVASWAPMIGPEVSTVLEESDGVITDIMADGDTEYADEIIPAFSILELNFGNLTYTDLTNFRSFRSTVKNSVFEMFDPVSQSYRNVRLVLVDGRQWDVTQQQGEFLSVKIRVRALS